MTNNSSWSNGASSLGFTPASYASSVPLTVGTASSSNKRKFQSENESNKIWDEQGSSREIGRSTMRNFPPITTSTSPLDIFLDGEMIPITVSTTISPM